MGIGYDEWHRIPWWAQRAYVEGLIEEGLLAEGSPEPFEIDPLGASAASFQELGMRVIQGG